MNHNSGVLSEIGILYCAWRIGEGDNYKAYFPKGELLDLGNFLSLFFFSKQHYGGYLDHCWRKQDKDIQTKKLMKHSLGKSNFRDLLLCTVWVDRSSWQRRMASGAWGSWSHCVHSWGAARGYWFLLFPLYLVQGLFLWKVATRN